MARRILLIDDERVHYGLTQGQFDHFKTERFDLVWMSTYEDGLRELLTGTYAACLLDFQLGPRDGIALIREAVAHGCHTPIIFLTGETSEKIYAEALEAGALDFFVKGELNAASLERSLRYTLKLAETLEEARRLATRDALTGLLNRREFERILAEELDRAQRFARPLALVMLDVDHFKNVNDAHGHPAGDAVLREVAARLAREVRTIDRVARVGGEEFAAILMETGAAEAAAVAERLLASIRSAPIAAGEGVELRVTASAGVAAFPTAAETPAMLVKAADAALYAAKRAGRDRCLSA